MATLNFDASQVQPSTGAMDAIPAGWYNAMIDQSELKPTKAADGSMFLELRFSVADGQYAGRKLFSRLNIVNANPVAKEIAYKDLSAICHATGILRCADSQQLHNIPMKIKVSLKPADGQYEASNDIKAYRNINEQVGTAPAGMGTGPAPFTPPPAAPQWAPPPAAQPQFQQPAPQPQAPQWQQPQAAQPWAQPAPQQPQQPQAPQFQQPQAPVAQPAWTNGAPQQGAPAPVQQAPAQFAAAPSNPQGFVPPAAPPWAQQPAPQA